MKVTEHIDRARNPLISFEIIPPKAGENPASFFDLVASLSHFRPAWINLTSHYLPDTYEMCGEIRRRFGVDTVAHVLSATPESAWQGLRCMGVQNILALRGEREGGRYAAELVERIHKHDPDYCVGVAGYPEMHPESPNEADDLMRLKEKVDAGADYILSQMFFDNETYFEFERSCRRTGITVPIVPGLKILNSIDELESLPRRFHVGVPDDLQREMRASPLHAAEIGRRWAERQVRGLLTSGVRSLQFFVMRDVEPVTRILRSVFS